MAESPKEKTETDLSVASWKWRLSPDGKTFEPANNLSKRWLRKIFNFSKGVLLCAGFMFLSGLLWGYYVISAIPGAKPHFISLIHRWLVKSTGAISSNPLGFALLVVEPLATLLVAGFLLIALRGWEEMKQELAKSISVTFVVTLAVQVILFGPVFIWHGVDVVFLDHQNLETENQKIRGERDRYKQQADRVPTLEQQINTLEAEQGKKPKIVTRTVQVPVPAGQDTAELARIQQAEQARREKRKATRQIIASDYATGNDALNLLYNKNLSDEAVTQSVQNWADATEKHLRENLGDDYVIRFRNSAGINTVTPMNMPPSAAKEKLWWPIYFRIVRLNQFLEELKDQ